MVPAFRLLMLAIALWPGLAGADPSRGWGVPLVRGAGQSELHLRRCDGGCFAQVAFVNRQMFGPALTRVFALDLEGFAVTVTVVEGVLRAPDALEVTPPPGFYAEPATISVDEDATGVIALFPMAMS